MCVCALTETTSLTVTGGVAMVWLVVESGGLPFAELKQS
jgi:hypothetical protein